MSRLQCLGKSSTSPQKQLAADVTSAHAEMHKPNGCSPKDITPRHERKFSKNSRVEKHTQSTAVPVKDLKMKDLRKSADSPLTGGTTHYPPPAEPNGGETQSEEEDVEDEDIKAPLELIMKFLRAVMDRDFQLASTLCQMILIYEPDHPEASVFLPLIQKKLLEEREAQQSSEEEDDDSEDSGKDEESSPSSSCSCSPSDDDEEEEKQVNRHKPCPPSHVPH